MHNFYLHCLEAVDFKNASTSVWEMQLNKWICYDQHGTVINVFKGESIRVGAPPANSQRSVQGMNQAEDFWLSSNASAFS